MKPLRLGIVLPRFGSTIVGGAELHGRWLAEHLASAGHSVEILTTCAVDHNTWRNELEPGVSSDGLLTVRRFLAEERDLEAHRTLSLRILQGDHLSPDDERSWLRNGVSSRAMEGHLRTHASDYDLVVAMPYLFGTTYFAHEALPDKVALIPCLHDEPFARMGFVIELLERSRGLLFNTEPEIDIARRLSPRLADPHIVAVGFEAADLSNADAVRARYGLTDPYLLYVGRREPGKNTHLLVDYLVRYKQRRSGDLKLVCVGTGDALPVRDDIVELRIDWADRDAICAGATAFCQPSINESLSIVLMQAWAAGAPAIVHAECAVTKHHCEVSNGGLWFRNYAEFEAIVDRLSSSEQLRSALSADGRRYVEQEYAWPVVIDRFHEAVDRWVSER